MFRIFLQETYEVLDTLVRDGGTSSDHNDSLWNSVTQFTRNTNDTTVNGSTQTYTSQYTVENGYIVELNITDITSYCVVQIARYQTGGTTTYHYQYTNYTGKMVIEVLPTQLIFKQNDTVLQTINNITSDKFRAFFISATGEGNFNFKYKDFQIYPI